LKVDKELSNDLGDHILEAVADLDLVSGLVSAPVLVVLGSILNIIEDQLSIVIV